MRKSFPKKKMFQKRGLIQLLVETTEEASWTIFMAILKQFNFSHGCMTSGCRKAMWVMQPGSERTMQIIWQLLKKIPSSAVSGVKELQTHRMEWMLLSKSKQEMSKGKVIVPHSLEWIRWHHTRASACFLIWSAKTNQPIKLPRPNGGKSPN